MEESQKRELKIIQRQKIRTVILMCLLIFVLGTVGFTYFRITTEGRLALREGKNVKLALEMLDIEYYGEGKSIYNPNRANGMENGVEQQVYNIVEQSGKVQLQSYDRSERKIRNMVYEEGSYRVVYTYDETNGDQWKVDYLVTIFDYTN